MAPGLRKVERGAAGYPPLLAEAPGAPAALWVSGRPLEPAPYVGVVGTRRASRYGLEVATWMGRDLAAAGAVVVSGMAAGIDAAAHRGALATGSTVAVLGSGVDVCYPRSNAALYAEIAEQGSLVSEYPPGTTPAPWRFPARNRIIAGMGLGVVIVEARRDGGAMITARLALEYGREVFAVAGPVHASGSEGPHALVGGELARVQEDLPAVVPETARSHRKPARFTAALFGRAVRRGRLRLRGRAVAASVFGDLDFDLAAVRARLHRVADQVEERVLQSPWIGLDHGIAAPAQDDAGSGGARVHQG